MRYCSQCGALVSDQARFCEHCGVEIQNNTAPSVKVDLDVDELDLSELDEKVKGNVKINRNIVDNDEVFSKICPMCGEDMQINKNLLENTPVVVKCIKCGHETKIW